MSDEDKTDLLADENVSTEESPKKPVKKRAAKKAVKRARKKTSEPNHSDQSELLLENPKATGAKTSESPDFVPGEISANTRKSSVVWSSDNPEKPDETSDRPEKNNFSGDSKTSGSSKEDGEKPGGEAVRTEKQQNNRHRNPRNDRNDHRSKRSGKGKGKGGPGAHSGKKDKGRWQGKNKRKRGEDTLIELGDLPNFELLSNPEALQEMADELSSGSGPELDFNHIYEMGLSELREAVAAAGIEMANVPKREKLVNTLIEQAGSEKKAISAVGVLELLEDDAGGLLVYECDNYRVKPLSAYVPQIFVERYGLQRGHTMRAQLHPHREDESCPFVVNVYEVMGRDPNTLGEIVPFTEGVPYYPLERILMESDPDSHPNNLSMRVVDCLTPVGFGQRGLIVAPPRTGKTVLLQGMANSIQKNYPEAHLIILLIDERPEEVTDFRRQVSGEVVSSTFDESAENHVHVAEMVIEKSRRMVETGKNVVILLDSITRLARAYNTTMPNSGKILSGGVEANALQKPKRFFGSARNIEGGGSLTIIATALVETGSKMDEVIFEEFKGTGNMELHLDRGLSDKRIFPALSMDKSGTRKEELLYHPDEMLKIYSLRRAMKGLPSVDAMEMLIQRIKKTRTNAEFLMSVSG